MSGLNYFERLGLPRRFDLASETIEKQYLARSREVHPDFHQLSSSIEQQTSLELSSAINQAYQVIREPFARADYLLQLEGGPSASETAEMPTSFLAEVLELREQIEELKASNNTSSKLEEQLESRKDSLLGDIGKQFSKLEGLPTESIERSRTLLNIRQLLNASKYIQGLLRDFRE
jgi:molecular chaperone HscB